MSKEKMSCGVSSVMIMKIPQTCVKPSIYIYIYTLFINVTSVSSTKQYIRQYNKYCQPFMGFQVTVQRQVFVAFYRHYDQRDKIGGTHTNLHRMTQNIIKSCLKTTVVVHNYINGAISPVLWPDRRSNHGGQPTLASHTSGCHQDNRRYNQPE